MLIVVSTNHYWNKITQFNLLCNMIEDRGLYSNFKCAIFRTSNFFVWDFQLFSLVKALTVICNLQQAFELFGNEPWVFQNSLNPGASGGQRPQDQGFALDPPWALQPQHHFQVFNFGKLSPLKMNFIIL